MSPTKIEWSEETWNPTTGCDRVSPGCDHCYALTLAGRLKAMGQAKYQRDGDPRTSGPGFGLTVHPDALDLPLRWHKPRLVFVNSMSDLFHPGVPDEFIADVFRTMLRARHHTFQVLTKRPQRMARWVQEWGPFSEGGPDGHDLRHIWLGASIESDRYAFRADHLRATPAAVRFLSLEPLLGPLPSLNLSGIDWVIVGGESGPNARPMHPDWARDLRDRCVAAGVPFFFKQWGQLGPIVAGGVSDEGGKAVVVADDGTVYWPGDLSWPDGRRRIEAIRANHDKANLTLMYGVGKKASGRELDGRTWDEMPTRSVL